MRDVKFRGKLPDSEQWMYGFYTVEAMPWPVPSIVVTENGEIVPYEIIPSTVGEYTGLHDKKGKEIYEGDMVKNQCAQIGTVEFHQGQFVAKYGELNGYWHSLNNHMPCTVIGNIHDKEAR